MLYKRPGSKEWQIKFTLDGQTIRRSSRTSDRKLAERVEHSLREGVIKARLSGAKAPFSWEQAKDLWRAEKATKRSLATDDNIFRLMDEFFKGCDVSELTADACAKYRQIVANRASPSTANRHGSLLRAVLKLLAKRSIIDKAPAIEEYKLEYKEPVWTTPEQIRALLNALPDFARDVAEFALATGLRKSNVTGLKWDWVKLDAKMVVIPARNAKGKRTMPIPLPDAALEILQRNLGKDPVRVFVSPLRARDFVKRAFEKARLDVGMPHFRFHDLRHAWASFHSVNGTPERVLQELGGWQNNKMVQRYAHLRHEDLAKYANNTKL